MEHLDKICLATGLDGLNDNKYLRNLCSKVEGLKPAYPVFAFSALVLLLLSFDIMGPCLSTFVGFLYPFLASLKSIEHNDADLIKQWLSYWIVFSFVIYFDGILSLVLFFLPLYEFFKSLFFIWLFNPKTNGIAIIQDQVLVNLVRQVRLALEKLSEEKKEEDEKKDE